MSHLFIFNGLHMNFFFSPPSEVGGQVLGSRENSNLKIYIYSILHSQQLGLNIAWGNKLGIECEIINTICEYTYYIP